MNFRDRLPHPRGGWASAQPFLEMTEEEYRAWLKEQGYTDRIEDRTACRCTACAQCGATAS